MKKITRTHTLALLFLAAFSLACTVDLGKYLSSDPEPAPANTAMTANNTAPLNSMTDNAANSAAPEAQNSTASKTPDAKKTPANSKPAGTNNPTATFEKISFAKGRSSTTVTHSIAPGVNKIYAFSGNAGQVIDYKVSEKTGQLVVEDEGMPQSLNVMQERAFRSGGEYRISISNPTNQMLTYTFYLSIK